MILIMRGDVKQVTRRLTANGVDVTGDAHDTCDHGLELHLGEVGERQLSTATQVTVRKNALQVTLNPKVSACVGYTPAYPTLLTPGWLGPVEVGFQTPEDCAMVAALGLEWLATVSLVPVCPLWE